MAEVQRTVQKVLACEEDLNYGEGSLVQTRGEGSYTVNKIRGFRPVNSQAELDALDPDRFPKAVLVTGGELTFYQHNGTAYVEVVPNTANIDTRVPKLTDLVFATVADMKAGTTVGGIDASTSLQAAIDAGDISGATQGYYSGWAALAEPQGAGDYILTTRQRVRDTKSDSTWEPNTHSDHYLFGGTTYVAVLKYNGPVSIKALGARSTEDKSFDNKELIKAIGRDETLPQDIYVPAGTFYSTYTLNAKRVLRIHGEAGTQATSYPSILQFENCVGVVFHRHNTDADDDGSNQTVVASGGRGDGSLLRHLNIKYDQGSDPTPDGATHGVWYRARADVRNCQIAGFPGNNIHVVATSGSGDVTREGNANNFDLGYCRIINAGGDGFYADGADANAGVIQHCDSSSNAGWGFNDESFLGNQYFGCHTNGNGVGNSKGGFRSEDANARCAYIGCYTEPGQGANNNVVSPSVIVGGLFGANDGNALEYRDGEIRNCSAGYINQIFQERAVSGTGNYVEAWNTGSFSASRGARHTFKAGLVDGNNEYTGAVFGLPRSSSVDARHSVGLEIYDGIADGWEKVFTARGDDNTWRWGVDNQWNFGAASFRAKEIFAANGTINTSDEREKKILGGLTEAEKSAALELKANIIKFQWNDSIAVKGDNGARVHIGVGAQTVKSIMESHGLDPFKYAFLCFDEWDAEYDEEGNVTLEAGSRYGVRLDQINAFILSAI